MLTFALGHEQLPSSYRVVARPALELSRPSCLPSSSPPHGSGGRGNALKTFVTQALEPVA